MSKTNIYLERYAWPEHIFPDYDTSNPLEVVVVIPAYNETSLIRALKSLDSCTHNEHTLVIVIINESENERTSISTTNDKALEEIYQTTFDIPILVKKLVLPEKKAGVGLARKIGMDEAVKIFEGQGTDGVIVCFDADCTCELNYLQEIKAFYQDHSMNVGLVHYEHDLRGENYDAIVNYELYLRYYVNALRWAGFPFALQTLGSCITVRSKAYQKQGGMNTRKAGEDFYFIHKMTPLGGIGEINGTFISPSDRVSDRVPFGTGHAVQKFLDQTTEGYEVYNPMIFVELKQFIKLSKDLYLCDSSKEIGYSAKCIHFMESEGFENEFIKIKEHSANHTGFEKRFYQWFDGFRVLKFVHFMRDHYFQNIDITDALGWLHHNYTAIPNFGGAKEVKLTALREFDRKSDFWVL